MTYRIEIATAYEGRFLQFYDFRSTDHVYTKRHEAEGDFDLLVKFNQVLAVRLLDSDNEVLLAWEAEDGWMK